MPTALVNGINLYYELHGPQDAEVLVLSNGIMMSTASWGFQTAELAKHMRVLLYDCRGMWKSDHPKGPYSMEQHADDLKGLLDALGIQQAHIGGISYGSEISMLFAIRYPQYTRSLIVMDGVSEIHPLLKGQTYPWLMAAKNNDPELLLRTSYHLNFAGMAGAMYSLWTTSATHTMTSAITTINVLIMVILGGMGTLVGPIIGAGLMQAFSHFLYDIFGARWPLFFGIIFILIVLFFPYGITGTWQLRKPAIKEKLQQLMQLIKPKKS